jgi:hypothetical protein
MSAQDQIDSEEDPLLPATKGHIMKSYINVTHWLYPETAKHTLYSTREKVRHWLSSKIGHYFVLSLVGLDVAGIVAGNYPMLDCYHVTKNNNVSKPSLSIYSNARRDGETWDGTKP